MTKQELIERFETKADGHDFFSAEMCDNLIKNGIKDEDLHNALDGADLEINELSMQLVRAEAYEACATRMQSLREDILQDLK